MTAQWHVGPKYCGDANDHGYAVRNDDGVVYGLFFTRETAEMFAECLARRDAVAKAVDRLRKGLTDEFAWSTSMEDAIALLTTN